MFLGFSNFRQISPFVSLLQDLEIDENENMAQIGCFARLDSNL